MDLHENLEVINITISDQTVGAQATTDASLLTQGILPDARISETGVTQHQGAVEITESQISDLGDYATQASQTSQDTQIELRLLISDINDTLLSTSTVQPLSANQGRALKVLIDNLSALVASDDTTLDKLQEIVDYIKINRSDLEALNIVAIAGLQAALDAKASQASQDAQDTLIAQNTVKNTYPTSDAGKVANLPSDQNQVNTDLQSDIDSRATQTSQDAQDTAIGLNTAKRSYPVEDENKVANLPADQNTVNAAVQSDLSNKLERAVIAEEVTTDTYQPVSADIGKTKVFTNIGGCKILAYEGTPPDGWNIRARIGTSSPVQIGFQSNISGGGLDYYESDGGDIIFEYYNSSLGWHVTGPVAVYDATRGPELFPDPNFDSAGSGLLQLNESAPAEEITFAAGEMTFFSTTESPQFMQLRAENILTVGEDYEITVVTTAYDGTAPLRTNSLGSVNVSTGVGTITFTATATNASFQLLANGDGVDVTITSISVKQIIA